MSENLLDEKCLDEKLKGAGLWEDGMNLEEKRQLCAFLADSCSSAQHEEQQRQQQLEHEQQQRAQEQVKHQLREEQHSSEEIEELPSSGKMRAIRSAFSSHPSNLQTPHPSEEGATRSESQETVTYSHSKEDELPDIECDGSSSESMIKNAIANRDALNSGRGTDLVEEISSNLGSQKKKKCVAPLRKSVDKGESDPSISPVISPCNVTAGSDTKFPFDTSQEDFSLDQLSDRNVHSSTFVARDEQDESEQYLLLEDSKNSTTDLNCSVTKDTSLPTHEAKTPLKIGSNSGGKPVMTVTPVVKNGTLSEVTSAATSPAVNEQDVFYADMYMPSLDIVKLHSQRKDELHFKDPKEYRRAPADVKKRIYENILVSLTKTSIMEAAARACPDSPVAWTSIIKQATDRGDEANTRPPSKYSLRHRRNPQRGAVNSKDATAASEDFDDFRRMDSNNDRDWIPSNRQTKRKRLPPPVNKRLELLSKLENKIPEVECQDSDDEVETTFSSKKTATSSHDEARRNTPVLNSVTSRDKLEATNKRETPSTPCYHFDKALTSAIKKENAKKKKRSNSPEYDSSDKLTRTTNEDTSDNEVMEIDQVGASLPRQRPGASNSTSKYNNEQAVGARHMAQSPVRRSSLEDGGGLTRHTASPVFSSSSSRRLGVAGPSSWAVSSPQQEVANSSGWQSSPAQDSKRAADDGQDVVIRPGPLKFRAHHRLGNKSSVQTPTTSRADQSVAAAAEANSSSIKATFHSAGSDEDEKRSRLSQQQLEQLERREFIEEQKRRNVLQQIQQMKTNRKQMYVKHEQHDDAEEQQKRLVQNNHKDRLQDQQQQQKQFQQEVQEKQQQQYEEEQRQLVAGANDAEDEELYQCPLCSRLFPLLRIEIHAANCDGSSPKMIGTRNKVQQKRQQLEGTGSSRTSSPQPSSTSHAGRGNFSERNNGASSSSQTTTQTLLIDNSDDEQDLFSNIRGGSSGLTPGDTSALGRAAAAVVPSTSLSENNSRSLSSQQQHSKRRKLLSDSDDDDCVVAGDSSSSTRQPVLDYPSISRNSAGCRSSTAAAASCRSAAGSSLTGPGHTPVTHEFGPGGAGGGPKKEELHEEESVQYPVAWSPPRHMVPISQQTDSFIDYLGQYARADLPARGRRRTRGGRRRSQRGRGALGKKAIKRIKKECKN